MKRAIAGFLVALSASGCGSAATTYGRSEAAAERAYAAGRYSEAALAWQTTASRAAGQADHDEALYRAAKSYERAGRPDEAIALLARIAHGPPGGVRAARAGYDVAVLLHDNGHPERAAAELDAVIRSHPESGVAARALERRLEGLDHESDGAARQYLAGLVPALDRTELGQYVHYSYARSLERSGELAAARDRYVLVAARYPHPAALWDDALFHAAELDVQLGEAEAAIARLTRLLEKREASYFQGSYERRRYAEAQFLIGELYRDALHDPKRARAAFERLWAAHPSSRLRDDAAWNAARLAAAEGDEAGACADLRALVAEVPTSRYAPCVTRMCPALAPAKGECHDYIARGTRRDREEE